MGICQTTQVLTTERLIVREFGTEDISAAHIYSSDAEVVRYQAWGPNTFEETAAFVNSAIAEQSHQRRLNFNWAVRSKGSNAVLGGCSMFVDESGEQAEIGFSFSRKHWGSGYATEGARGLIEFAFKVKKLKKLRATADVRNEASKNVLRKVGFKETTIIKNQMQLRSGPRDTAVFELTAGE